MDNLLFYGLVIQKEKINKNLRNLVQRLEILIAFNDNPSYQTIFYNIGDGIAVSIR